MFVRYIFLNGSLISPTNFRVFEYVSNASRSEETRIAAIKACDAQNISGLAVILVRNKMGAFEALYGITLGALYSAYIMISYYEDPKIYIHAGDSITSKNISIA